MCGNLGLLLCGGYDQSCDARDLIEAMALVTSMRGAQSFGFVTSTSKRMKLYKQVVPKRVDIAKAMRNSLQVRKNTSLPLAIAAHMRFATSSKTTREDAHPHVWLKNATALILTVNPQTSLLDSHRVARATVITHNGDFDAFDIGKCFFGKESSIVSLDTLRNFLEARLGTPAPSNGDSIVAAGLLEMLFTAGDPYASVRLAFATLDTQDSAAPLHIVKAASSSLARVLLQLPAAMVSELSYTLNGGLTRDIRTTRITRVTAQVAEDFAASTLLTQYAQKKDGIPTQNWLETLAVRAVTNFFEADLRSAVRTFLKHAHGSFGLVVTSSLASQSLVIASIKQPLQIGVGRGIVAYGSERAALHVGPVGSRLLARRVLNDGEIVWIAPSTSPNENTTVPQGTLLPVCACRISVAMIDDERPFRPLNLEHDFDGVLNNKLMMPIVDRTRFQGDVVAKEIAEIPQVLAKIRDSFRDVDSTNSWTASALGSTLFDKELAAKRSIDLLVIGTEASLWVGEQWTSNLRSTFPKLRTLVVSGNKVLALLTAVAYDATCGAQTPGFTTFPGGLTPAAAVRGAVALVITHSGQTFPSLNAARALRDNGAIVFAVTGMQDTVIASDVLEQSFNPNAPHSERLFSTDAGVCLAESASVSTVATHVLLTELLYALAKYRTGHSDCSLLSSDVDDLRTLHDASIDTNVNAIIEGTDTSSKSMVHAEATKLGKKWGRHVAEPFLAFIATVFYVLATVTAGTPLFYAIFFIGAGFSSKQNQVLRYMIAAVDALLYAFFPVVFSLFLRLVQGREMLARFGKRTVLVLDVPQVHQCIGAFAQKLFALSYGLNSVEIHSANPMDHAVHRCLYRITRGTLVAIGVPDGRLKTLVDVECAAYLTASQIKSIQHWNVGPELVTIGHHSYKPGIIDGAVIFDFERPAFLSEFAHGTGQEVEEEAEDNSGTSKTSPTSLELQISAKQKQQPSSSGKMSLFASLSGSSKKNSVRVAVPSKPKRTEPPDSRRVAFLSGPKNEIVDESRPLIGRRNSERPSEKFSQAVTSHTTVETLYEGRIATLERQLGFYILFHAMAKTASNSLWPFFDFDISKSQAGTRVATTPSPTSPNNIAAESTSTANVQSKFQLDRITTMESFQHEAHLHHHHIKHSSTSSLFHRPQWRSLEYDTLSACTDDESQGLDLSAHDQVALFHLPPSSFLPA